MTEELKKKVWAFSLPMISELFVQQLYSVIDIAIIGRYLGAKELGAVGWATRPISSCFSWLPPAALKWRLTSWSPGC